MRDGGVGGGRLRVTWMRELAEAWWTVDDCGSGVRRESWSRMLRLEVQAERGQAGSQNQ
jgi:hypothetical protein